MVENQGNDVEECDKTMELDNFDDNKAKIKLKRELGTIDKLDDDQKHYPHKSTLVINAILACLEDESPVVQRTVLEFMYTHLKLSMKLFTKADKLVLVEAVLYLLIKKENTHDRRIYDWLFGKPNLDNKYAVEEKDDVFLLIMDAIARIFKTAPANQNAIPLKILQKLFIMNEGIVESTLNKLSLKILNYMYKYHEGFPFSGNFAQQCSKFFENIRSHFALILKSFFVPLGLMLNDKKEKKEKKDRKCEKIIKLIEFTFNEIFIKKEANYIQILEGSEFMIMNILRILHYFDSDDSGESIIEFKFVLPAIDLCLKLIECFENVQNKNPINFIGEENEELEKVKEIPEPKIHLFENSPQINANILQGFSQVYGKIVTIQKDKLEQAKKHKKSDVFNEIINLEENNNNEENHEIDNNHNYSIDDAIIELFNLSSKILVKSQRFLKENKLDKLPEWFYLIVECLNLSNHHISMIAIETIIDILNHSKDDSQPIFKQFNKLIISEPENRKLHLGTDYVNIIIGKLWAFLDFNAYQKKIVELVLDFQEYFEQIFKDATYESLSKGSLLDKEAAIRRFAAYWKLTNEDEFIKKKEKFVQIDDALFVMLDYLDHDNPLIRHTSKSWLMDSMNKLDRIIDPVYERLIEYDLKNHINPKIITEMFKRLKSILTSSNEEALYYISKNKLSFKLSDTVNRSEDAENLKSHNIYIDLLAILCKKFIEGPELIINEMEDMKEFEQKKEDFEVKKKDIENSIASSCEFLEMIINLLDPKQISQRICSKIIEPLLDVLNKAIDNNNLVMQVQVMNLLKVILFHSGHYYVILMIY